MKKVLMCVVMGAVVLGIIACADVREVFGDVDKKIDDFKEENHSTQKLDEVSDEANKALDDITR